MPIDESSVLRLASLIREATALGQAILDADGEEARFRAERVASHASEEGLTAVTHAAMVVIDCLGKGTGPVGHGCGQAFRDLSVALDQAQQHQLS